MKSRKASVVPPFLLALTFSAFGLFIPAPGAPALQTEDTIQIIRQVRGQISGPPEISFLPLVRRDAAGRAWVVWEERKDGGSRICLGRYEGGEIRQRRENGPSDEFNHSADLAFDRKGNPWLIWLAWTEECSSVFVREVNSGRTWVVGSTAGETLSGPRILFDRDGSPWTLWNQTGDRRGDIIYRSYDGLSWSEPAKIPMRSPFPALNPDAVLDDRGFICVVWSSYDGEDYELSLSSYNGESWLEPVRLTDNAENDVFPCVSLDASNHPIVGWTQVSEEGHRVCVLRYERAAAVREMILSPPSRTPVIPRIIGEKGDLHILWKSGDAVEVRPFPSARPRETAVQPSVPSAYPPLYNPGLNENLYIGFGDSITEGYIDRLLFPELGYVPRLDVILNQNFGSHRVLNRGVGGETTVGGLARIDSVLAADGARYILIMEGTNDVITDGLSMETSAFNLGEMVRRCLSAGVFPVIATILPRRDWVWFYPFYRNRLLDLNNKIRQFASSLAVPFIDMYTLFDTYPAADGGLTAVLSNDLKHPSEKGYQFMAETWFAEIRNFPFTPVNIELKELIMESGLRGRPSKSLASKPPANSPAAHQASGNLLIWKDNPKIFDPTGIKGYNIYRKRRDDLSGSFLWIAFVKQPLNYFDRSAALAGRYLYLIAALRKDGVEGPCGGPDGQ